MHDERRHPDHGQDHGDVDEPQRIAGADRLADLDERLRPWRGGTVERPADLAHEGELDLLIATDCISEGQNLQDCDYLINYDIHWNPVRIIQRFGRIDRIGSQNQCIQLVNYWPDIAKREDPADYARMVSNDLMGITRDDLDAVS